MERTRDQEKDAGLISKVTFGLAESEIDKQAIYDSRYAIGKDTYPFLFQSMQLGHIAKDMFDDESFLFYGKLAGEVIVSCRISPIIQDKWEVTDDLPKNISLSFDAATTIQINRLYVNTGFRDMCILQGVFGESASWILKNTIYETYFAVCSARLLRLYCFLGAELLYEEGFHLKGRCDHKYYAIHGNVREFEQLNRRRSLNQTLLHGENK